MSLPASFLWFALCFRLPLEHDPVSAYLAVKSVADLLFSYHGKLLFPILLPIPWNVLPCKQWFVCFSPVSLWITLTEIVLDLMTLFCFLSLSHSPDLICTGRNLGHLNTLATQVVCFLTWSSFWTMPPMRCLVLRKTVSFQDQLKQK